MANKINAKLILELKASGLSRNQIAATRHMSKHSVSDVINIAREKDITYEKVNHLSEDEVYRMIFPDKFVVENLYKQPDYEYVHQELKRVGVTLKLLWQEYQDKCKTSGLISMGYTKFCNGYADYTIVNKLTNHLENKPGVKAEVDWSGPTMRYIDTSTGEVVERIFQTVVIKEQGFNPALAVLRLSNKYSEARLEAACEFAITSGIRKPRYHHLNSILAANQDQIYLESRKTKKNTGAPMGYLGRW